MTDDEFQLFELKLFLLNKIPKQMHCRSKHVATTARVSEEREHARFVLLDIVVCTLNSQKDLIRHHFGSM